MNSPKLFFALCVLVISLYACKDEKSQKKEITEANTKTISEANPWDEADKILNNLIVPTFPDQEFNVQDYGAVADAETNNSEAFAKAIKACFDAGGGKVVVPAGKYVTGPIHLKSNVNFHVEEGVEILFSKNLFF